ncbi:hypothetical protein LTR53_006860 [Teratosphaeriaceae sp. CCFEE 6253]|nr:hypothetical protein LTR53_006860 [Teratosphaeriaceae sp. CCFEE 6253]
MFGLDSGGTGAAGVDHLEQTLGEKKQNVSSRHQQLQEIEARLRETEQRLARASRGSSPARQADTGASTTSAVSQQAVPEQAQTAATVSSLGPSAAVRPTAGGRVDTQTLMSGMPGAMPSTPGQYSESSDYVMVDPKSDRTERGYGQSVR